MLVHKINFVLTTKLSRLLLAYYVHKRTLSRTSVIQGLYPDVTPALFLVTIVVENNSLHFWFNMAIILFLGEMARCALCLYDCIDEYVNLVLLKCLLLS